MPDWLSCSRTMPASATRMWTCASPPSDLPTTPSMLIPELPSTSPSCASVPGSSAKLTVRSCIGSPPVGSRLGDHFDPDVRIEEGGVAAGRAFGLGDVVGREGPRLAHLERDTVLLDYAPDGGRDLAVEHKRVIEAAVVTARPESADIGRGPRLLVADEVLVQPLDEMGARLRRP